MTYELNDKIKGLEPYDPVAGDYKIRLDANESFINPGELFKKEIAEAVSEVAFNRYPDPTCKDLREAFGRTYGVPSELVVAGNGSDELITVILGAFLMAGDKLLTFAPDFSMYSFYGHTYEKQGIKIEKIQTNDEGDNLRLTANGIISSIKANSPQAVLFSNPCSPTSIQMSRDEIIEILEATKEMNYLLIVDEAYMEFGEGSVLDLVGKYSNLLVLKTCSKALGCAAIRLGFAVASLEIVKGLNAVRSPYNVNSITQKLGTLILSNPEYIKESAAKIIAARDELYKGLIDLEGGMVKRIVKPSTNFIYMEMNKVEEAQYIYEELLKSSIIVRRLGDALRITAGTDEENAAVIGSIREAIGNCR